MELKITPSGQTIVKPTALGPVANTDSKLLIYGLFQKGRVLAQDGTRIAGRNVTLPGHWCHLVRRGEDLHDRLGSDFTSIALPVLSQRVAIFFFADDRPLERCNLLTHWAFEYFDQTWA